MSVFEKVEVSAAAAAERKNQKVEEAQKTEAVLESLVSEARYEEALELLEQSFIFYSAEKGESGPGVARTLCLFLPWS